MFQLSHNQLERVPLEAYFKAIERLIINSISVEDLTAFFTNQPFLETKPYLFRRILIPIDKRFSKIELVYESINHVKAIVWHFDTTLSELKSIFGEAIIHHEPYSNSTAVAFLSQNKNIDVIKTRHNGRLLKNEHGLFEYYNNGNQRVELLDPEFDFLQITLKTR